MSFNYKILKNFLPLILIIFMKKELKIMIMLSLIFMNFNMNNFITKKISYFMMSDLISFWMTNLTLWIFFILMILTLKKESFMILTKMMMMTLNLIFNIWNMLLFFILFEMSMLIIISIMIIWKYQLERLEAMFFMLFFTLIFSLPFLLTIMNFKKSLNFIMMEYNFKLFVSFSFLMFFLTKIPVFFIHMWLPKAHVESPVFGSMILAAILLKLGSYGIIRSFKIYILFYKMNYVIFSITIWSMLILSASCMILSDIKMLIAYSSIIHMNLTIINLLMFKYKSILSAMIINLGHGLCSSLLFFLSNTLYNISKSRSILINKGLSNLIPSFKFWWFINCMNNVPVPPSLNLMGEIMSLKMIFNFINKSIYLMFLVSFFSSMFSIYIFFTILHGKLNKNKTNFNLINLKTSLISLIHMLPLMMISTKMNMIII